MNNAGSCESRISTAILLLAVVLLALAMPALGQNPILQIAFDREILAIPLEGSASAWLVFENVSVQEADAIEVAWLSGPAVLSPVPPIEVLDAFSETRLPIVLSASEGAALGTDEATFELSYTYCVGDLCFQIIEELTLGIEFTPAAVEPIDVPINDPSVLPDEGGRRFSRFVPLALGLVLAAALIAGKRWGRRWWIMLVLVAVIAIGLGYGVLLEQDQQAQSIGAVLCTSCVGIEETPHEEPDLSDVARERIAAITDDIELLLFTATWCSSCPFAKAMVQQAITINPKIAVQWVDVDVTKDAARQYGIIQSGRTIVPAILRVDTQEVIFGVENLEARLLALLEDTP